MSQNKPIILIDPYPRTMDLLFSKENLKYLKKNFNLITAPNKNKNNFYEKNLSKADYIFGQPNLPSSLISKSTKLKAIFNVCLLYTSPSPRDQRGSRMPSSA